MSEESVSERRSWFPLALAGGFVVFALVIAVVGYLANDESDPSQVTSVGGVAQVAVESVDEADDALATGLACRSGIETPWTSLTTASTATISRVKGDATGSFRLTISDEQGIYDITVAKDGNRSCIDAVAAVG